MTNSSSEKKEPFKKELEQLKGGNSDLIIQTINTLRSRGNNETTYAIISLLKDRTISVELKNEIYSYLFDLKNQLAIEPLFEAIHDSSYKAEKAMLISVLWQSSIDGTEHMIEIVEQLEDANFEEVLEILTVLENLDGPFNEDEVFEAIALVNEQLEINEDERIQPLLESILDILNNF